MNLTDGCDYDGRSYCRFNKRKQCYCKASGRYNVQCKYLIKEVVFDGERAYRRCGKW